MTFLGQPKMTITARVRFLLNFEPTWFPEFSAALAITVWGWGAWWTDEFTVSFTGYAIAAFCMAFGVVRWLMLLRLWWGPRALAAIVSAAFWAWVLAGLLTRFGMVPSLGQTCGILVADMLTLARFSLPCARDLINEYRGWRAAK